MTRQLVLTEDGSHTIFIPEMGEHFHSVHGAIQESRHIFINNGYHQVQNDPVSILEIGFGTGLNAILTLMESEISGRSIQYETWEAYPLTFDESRLLNYPTILNIGRETFDKLHQAEWGVEVQVTPRFLLKKVLADVLCLRSDRRFDLVYFDAFGPDYQPELWNLQVFQKIYHHMNASSVLTTYSAKGQVRRNLRDAGFGIVKLPGPPGKREITMAIKKTVTHETQSPLD